MSESIAKGNKENMNFQHATYMPFSKLSQLVVNSFMKAFFMSRVETIEEWKHIYIIISSNHLLGNKWQWITILILEVRSASLF